MTRQRFGAPYLLIFGRLFLLTSTVQLYRFLNERSDIWWTPAASSIPLHASRDRVEIHAHGTLLHPLLEDGQLRLGADADSPVLGVSELNLRFNNWDRVRAERIPQLLMYAANAGGAAALVLVGLITAWSGRPRRRTVAG